jgi:aarF domain-containing kinase
MYRYSFRLPPYYTLLVRSLSVLEGIALASDPNYKVGGVEHDAVAQCAASVFTSRAAITCVEGN